MKVLYTLYDCKSETYLSPTAHPARGEAIRSFSKAVNDGQSVVSSNPEDFTLFEIGTFDDRTGVVSLYDARIAIGNGVDFKQVA